MPADGTALTGTLRVPVKPARMKREPTFILHQQYELTTPEKGGAVISIVLARFSHRLRRCQLSG
jgi:hypothetical protein